MANGIDFNPSVSAAASSGWGGLAGGSNAVNGGQMGGGSTATPGVGGTPTVSSNSSGVGSAGATMPWSGGAATAVTPSAISSNPSLSGAGVGSATPQTPVQTVTGQKLDSYYGPTGNMTLPEYQQWQSEEFNRNQLAAQGQFNAARAAMPYNTQGNLANPYDQYVANPATATAPSSALATGNTFASGGNQAYQNNQLQFLLQALQNYGPGGQNRFGNGFSPVFTGASPNGSLMNGLGNSSGNPGGYQSNSGGGSDFSLAQLLPLLIGLAQQPGAGAYGNLG